MKKMFLAVTLAALLFAACGSSSKNEDSSKNDTDITINDTDAAEAKCGDGKIDANETCDGGTKKCTEISGVFTGGEASCKDDCSAWSTKNCISPEDDEDIVIPENCGNDKLDSGEVCDGTAIKCSILDSSYESGDAFCKKDCSGYIITECKKAVLDDTDTSELQDDESVVIPDEDKIVEEDKDTVSAVCGNSIVEEGETCEKGETIECSKIGKFSEGTAVCYETCLGWNATECKLAEDVKLYPIKVSGKWGYIDPNGNVIIDPASHDFTRGALYFHEGLAPVQNDDYLWGFIDSTGNYVIESKYDMVGGFSEGFCNVGFMGQPNTVDDDYWTFIDKTGNDNVLGGVDYEVADPFSEGLAAVTKNGLVGFINTKGELVIDFKYKEALSFVGGMCPVKDASTAKWFYIDTNGKKLFGKEWDLAKEFNEGFAVVGRKIGSQDGQPIYKYQYIDTKGNVIFNGKEFDGAIMFSEGVAGVKEGDNWSYLDAEGKVVIGPTNQISLVFFSYFKYGFAVVSDSVTGKYGFINKKGETVIPFNYDLATPFFGELAQIIIIADKKYKYGFINQKGEVVWEPQN